LPPVLRVPMTALKIGTPSRSTSAVPASYFRTAEYQIPVVTVVLDHWELTLLYQMPRVPALFTYRPRNRQP
jgi:hypothetical protein